MDGQPACDPSCSPKLSPWSSASEMTSGCQLRPPGFECGCQAPPASPPGPQPYTHRRGRQNSTASCITVGSAASTTPALQTKFPNTRASPSFCAALQIAIAPPTIEMQYVPLLVTRVSFHYSPHWHTCASGTPTTDSLKQPEKGVTLDHSVPCRLHTLHTSERWVSVSRKRGGPGTVSGPCPVPAHVSSRTPKY